MFTDIFFHPCDISCGPMVCLTFFVAFLLQLADACCKVFVISDQIILLTIRPHNLKKGWIISITEKLDENQMYKEVREIECVNNMVCSIYFNYFV